MAVLDDDVATVVVAAPSSFPPPSDASPPSSLEEEEDDEAINDNEKGCRPCRWRACNTSVMLRDWKALPLLLW